MPLITPLRLAVIIVSFSLISFFWTFGPPRQQQLVQPAVPAIDHYDHKNVHTDSIISPPKPSARPAESDTHRWEDKTKENGEDGKATSTLLTKATPAVAPVPTHAVEKFCKDVPGATEIMVVLKTSKADIDSLSAHIHTLLSCVPHFAIFSDHSGEFNGHPVHDALDSITDRTKAKHAEFNEYHVTDGGHKPDPEKARDLDKWKMLPMVYKAYHMKPDAKFFVFIEAETSLSWANLLQWINRLDYRIPYYSGAPIFNSGTQLAQSGAGIMVSQGALRRYSKSYDELYTSTWEKNVGKECCGDLMLARAFADAHVELYSSWPLLQMEQPHTLDYTKRSWCVPVVSWFHVNGDSLTHHWEVEKNWTQVHGWNKPYLFRDAYHEYIEPHIKAQIEGWDNLSGDAKIVAPEGRQQKLKDEAEPSKGNHDSETEDSENEATKTEDAGKHKREDKKQAGKENKKQPPDWEKLANKFPNAADTPATCLKTCQQIDDCLQWRYIANGDGECHLAKVLRLGNKHQDTKSTSGWLVDRIKDVQKQWACRKVDWRFYQ